MICPMVKHIGQTEEFGLTNNKENEYTKYFYSISYKKCINNCKLCKDV